MMWQGCMPKTARATKKDLPMPPPSFQKAVSGKVWAAAARSILPTPRLHFAGNQQKSMAGTGTRNR